ncbi:MAG: hypothetical protein ACREDJ_00800 [Methylocella sp.]
MSSKSLFLSSLAVLALVALCAAVPAWANPPTTVTLTDNLTEFDVCSGENVHFVGTTTVSTAESIQNGIAHLQMHVIIRDDGAGQTTGARYKLDANENEEENAKLVNGAAEADIVVNAQIIGQGAVASESIKETFHETLNANGTLTVNRTDINMSCYG